MSYFIQLETDHGFLFLAATGAFVVNMWQVLKVVGKRMEFKIAYPKMWSDDHPVFDCYQRAHQNTLELTPFYLSLLAIGGLKHPRLSAASGFLYLLGRIVYSYGYYTGQPIKRMPGVAMTFTALGCLLLCALSTSITTIGIEIV